MTCTRSSFRAIPRYQTLVSQIVIETRCTILMISGFSTGNAVRAVDAHGSDSGSTFDMAMAKHQIEIILIPKFVGKCEYGEEELRQIIQNCTDQAFKMAFHPSRSVTPQTNQPFGSSIGTLPAGSRPVGKDITPTFSTAIGEWERRHDRNPSMTSVATTHSGYYNSSPELLLNPQLQSEPLGQVSPLTTMHPTYGSDLLSLQVQQAMHPSQLTQRQQTQGHIGLGQPSTLGIDDLSVREPGVNIPLPSRSFQYGPDSSNGQYQTFPPNHPPINLERSHSWQNGHQDWTATSGGGTELPLTRLQDSPNISPGIRIGGARVEDSPLFEHFKASGHYYP